MEYEKCLNMNLNYLLKIIYCYSFENNLKKIFKQLNDTCIIFTLNVVYNFQKIFSKTIRQISIDLFSNGYVFKKKNNNKTYKK